MSPPCTLTSQPYILHLKQHRPVAPAQAMALNGSSRTGERIGENGNLDIDTSTFQATIGGIIVLRE